MRRSPTQTKVSSKVSWTVQVRYLCQSRNATGREFQRHCPATEKLLSLSPRRVRVLFGAHVKTVHHPRARIPYRTHWLSVWVLQLHASCVKICHFQTKKLPRFLSGTGSTSSAIFSVQSPHLAPQTWNEITPISAPRSECPGYAYTDAGNY